MTEFGAQRSLVKSSALTSDTHEHLDARSIGSSALQGERVRIMQTS